MFPSVELFTSQESNVATKVLIFSADRKDEKWRESGKYNEVITWVENSVTHFPYQQNDRVGLLSYFPNQ
jgi:hypothetical protein